MNTKQKAISELQKQKDNIPTSCFYNGIWKGYTIEIIKLYIGENTMFYQEFIELVSDDKFKKAFRKTLGNAEFDKLINHKAIKLIDSCISYIKSNGVHSSHKINFISKISDTWLTFWAGLIVSFIIFSFWLGGYFAQNKIDQEKIEQKRKIENLTNSLLKCNKSLIDTTQPKSIQMKTTKR